MRWILSEVGENVGFGEEGETERTSQDNPMQYESFKLQPIVRFCLKPSNANGFFCL